MLPPKPVKPEEAVKPEELDIRVGVNNPEIDTYLEKRMDHETLKMLLRKDKVPDPEPPTEEGKIDVWTSVDRIMKLQVSKLYMSYFV